MRIDAQIHALLPSDNQDAWRQLASLRPGDQINARVAAILDNGQARIEMGGIRTVADIQIPVTVGDRLSLVVADVGETIHLRLATPADAVGPRVDGPLTADAMTRLRDLIQMTTGSTDAASARESALTKLLTGLNRHLAPIDITAGPETMAGRIRHLVEGSGLFFEKRLAALMTRHGSPTAPTAAQIKSILTTDARALLGRLISIPTAEQPTSDPMHSLRALAGQALARLDRAQDRLLTGTDRPLVYRAAAARPGVQEPPASLLGSTAGRRIRQTVFARAAGSRTASLTESIDAISRRLSDLIGRVKNQLEIGSGTDARTTGRTIADTAQIAETLARSLSDEADRTGLFLKSTHTLLTRMAAGRSRSAGGEPADRLQTAVDLLRSAMADDEQRIRTALDHARRAAGPTSSDGPESRPGATERGPEMGPSITFALPMAHTETPAHLRVYYRKRHGSDVAEDFRLSLLLCLDRLGEVRCDLWLHNRQLDIAFYTARESTRKRIIAEMVRLEPVLADRFERLAITTAMHPQRATAFEPTPLDIGSPSGVRVTA